MNNFTSALLCSALILYTSIREPQINSSGFCQSVKKFRIPDPHPDPLVTNTDSDADADLAPNPSRVEWPERYGSEDPDPHPDPYQNVKEPEHCL